jgi:F0F1-type ATP synthase membrane subunit b/b'
MNNMIFWLIIALLALVWVVTKYIDWQCSKLDKTLNSPWPESDEREWWKP